MTFHDLINLPVITESGTRLGRLADVALDTKGHTVEKYIVRTGTFAAILPTRTLLIDPRQVVSISDERMVVEDTVTPATAPATASAIG